MYLAIIILPILGSIVSGILGRKVGVSGAQFVTCLCIIITTYMATVGFLEVGLNNIPVSVLLFSWVDSELFNVFWWFNFDSLTVSMLIPVLIVSSLVHIYSIGYMSHDPHNQRFFSYLSLFTFMMIILVTANNYLLMFVGWEGVGVCSYLLVSFWFTRIAANQSSMSAFLTNRVGDCFLTLGMFAMILTFGNLDYSTVFSLAPYINGAIVTIIGVCLLIGAMAKSSQIGLHVWLPLAMEGPTPVSALIHAATMVTAGVYLLIRTSPLIEYSSTVLILCLWIGSITTVFSSLIGLFQQDIKKVIAYSTMSQLGMMVIAVGLSSYNVALFHLVNHAFYKGLLFLGAGAVIHAVADNQDFRKYGGLISFLPLTYTVMLIASLSLVAFPFMTGFYSKDFILESAYGQFNFSSVAVYFIATIGAMFTTLYSVKVLYLTFLTDANGPLINYKRAHEGDVFMSLPIIILAVFSIFFGYIAKDVFVGMASSFFSDNSLFTHPLHEIMLDTEFAVPTLFKLLPFTLTITLSALSLILSEFLARSLIYFKLTRLGYNMFSFFNQRFLIELFYNRYISRFILKLGGHTTKILDKGSIELLGPYGLEKGLLILSKSLSNLHTGLITTYALYILIGLILYILIPYISLINISILLCIIYGLLSITLNTFSLGIPQPHYYASLRTQSSLFKSLRAKFNLNWFTHPLFISIAIGVGLYLCYRLPLRFMLDQLDLHMYYPLFNVIVSLCSIIIIAYLTGKEINNKRMYLAVITAFIITVIMYFFSGDVRCKELFADLTYLLVHLSLIEILMPTPPSELKLLRPGNGSGGGGGSGNRSVDAHTQRGARGGPRWRHTQASSSSGNTAEGDKGKNSSYSHNGQTCAQCDSFGIKLATPLTMTCKLCGSSFNRFGKFMHRSENVEFKSDRLEFIANNPEVQKQIMEGNHEPFRKLVDDMKKDREFADRMVREVTPPQPAPFKVTGADFPPLGPSNINSDKDLPRLGSDKNIDDSLKKNKQKASVDQSSSSQNTVAQSPPSDKTESPSQPKAATYIPPFKRPGYIPGSSGGKKS